MELNTVLVMGFLTVLGTNIYVHLPAHPHAGLAGVCGGELGRRALGGALCRQHLRSLAGNVPVQLDELVQVHNA